MTAEVWFRPVWSGVEPGEWHRLRPGSLDDEEHAACGQSWPKRLTHGGFETRHNPTGVPGPICVNCRDRGAALSDPTPEGEK